MDRAAHAVITAGVTTAFHPFVYAKTLIQVRHIIAVRYLSVMGVKCGCSNG